MRKYSLSSRILYRLKLMLNNLSSFFSGSINYKMSRDVAKRRRKLVLSKQARQVVDQKLLRLIKQYCRDSFGSSSYWPWLAYYAELRGEFKEGWIPDDYYRFDLLPRMNPEKYMRFSEAKGIDNKLFDGSIIEPLFVCSNGQYWYMDGNNATQNEIEQFLKRYDDEIVVKPENGRGGKDIIFSHSKDLSLPDLPEGSNLVFQKVVEQHDELDRLYPHSINTFRVLTFINDEGKVEVKFIIIRFGQGQTRVDNASQDGGWIFVRKNGKVEPVGYNKYGLPIGRQHPDTGVTFSDLELPFISKVITLCQNAHLKFPYTRIIGWDVFVNKEGYPKLIEWNANTPFLEIVEALFGPFFKKNFELELKDGKRI